MAWDVIAHEWVEQLLAKHIAGGQVRHAYLFTGPPGVGRRTLALRFAQALNCLPQLQGGAARQPGYAQPGQPCRQCRACRLTERMQHPDLAVLERPAERTEILIEQVRALQHSLALSPYEARYRIGLLLRFHEASEQAQNALLKVLEEPPGKVILLLTADTPEDLLPTIVSRCEVLRLRPLEVPALENFLKQSRGVEDHLAGRIARLAAGRPGQALRLLAEPELLDRHAELVREALEIIRKPARERFAALNRFIKNNEPLERNRERLRAAYQTWATLWRDVYLLGTGADDHLMNVDCASDLRALASAVPSAEAYRVLCALEQSQARLGPPFYANPRLLSEVLLMDWPRTKE